jgi:uncharacterized protein
MTPAGKSAHVAFISVAVTGAAVVVLTASSGTTSWQIVRAVGAGLLTAAALEVVRNRPRRIRAGTSFAVGLVGLIVGVGFALPHVAKGDWSVGTVAALTALVSGLVATIAGSVDFVGSVAGWRRIPTIAGLVAVTFVCVSSFGTAVAATNVPDTELGSDTPADRGLDYADVELRTAHGTILSGWYITSDNGAAVVLVHGAGSTRSSVLDHAALLATDGYGVLLFDARGHGESDGQAMDFGWHGNEDLGAALAFLERQDDVDDERIAVAGLSMGGEQALGAAAADPRIRAVVAEGATGRVSADDEWLSEVYGWRGWVQEQLGRLTSAATDLLSDAARPISLREAVDVAERPTLLITAGDVPDEAHAARYIQSGSPETVEVWVVPETGHTEGLDTHPDEWHQRVVAFLEATLS